MTIWRRGWSGCWAAGEQRGGYSGVLVGLAMAGGVAALLLQPVVLRSVHLALELLME